jgi:hypothetical protein
MGLALFKEIARYAERLDQGLSYNLVLGMLRHGVGVAVQKGNSLLLQAGKRRVAAKARRGPSIHERFDEAGRQYRWCGAVRGRMDGRARSGRSHAVAGLSCRLPPLQCAVCVEDFWRFCAFSRDAFLPQHLNWMFLFVDLFSKYFCISFKKKKKKNWPW